MGCLLMNIVIAFRHDRAKNIALYITDLGIPAERVTYKGYGKRKPIASNKTPDGRRRNQRVELRVLKL